MADSNLNSSISALVSDLQNQIATATVTELLLITRAAKAIGHTENTAIEIAVNTRVNQLTSTATADELEKLARAVDNLTDTASATTATTSISDHTDVDTTTTPPTDGQALVWENSTALWKPDDVTSDSYTDILPDATATYDLGSPSKTWVDVYASNIKGLDAPINDTDAARKKYVDDLFTSAVVTVNSVNGYQGSVLLTTDDVDEGIYNLYYDDTKVDSHLNQTSATNNQILSWNGTDYTWVDNSSLSSISGNIIPDTTETYDLGSATYKFRDLYLSGNSITLGTIELSDNGGSLEITPVSGGGSTEAFATETYVTTQVNNLVDAAPGALDTLNELAAALGDDANFSTTITNQIAAKADAYSTVSVTTSSGKFYIDGEQQSIATLQPGRTYRFDQSAASNNSHPLRFSEVEDGTHAGGGATEYTTGVTVNGTAGNAGAYVEIAVTNATPRLYYYCANHTGMGGKVSVGKELFVERITSDTWMTGPIQTTTVNVATGGSISAQLATLDFTNTTVNFSGASITGLSNSDVDLANIADNAQGVVVTGKVAAGSLDLAIGGSINGQLTTLDFRDTTVNFSGATISGLDDTVQDEVDFHLNKNNASGSTIISDGQVLSWNATGGIQGTGDYEWIASATGGSVEISATAPSSPSHGDMWFDSTNLLMYIYYTDSGSSQWVQSGGSSGEKAEITNSENPPSAPAEGELWFDTSNLLLYVYYNDGTSSQWVQTSGFSSTSGLDVSDLTDTTNLLFDGQYSSLTGAPTSSTAGALGTLTKTFTQNEEAEITLSETISPVPNVSVFKEVPQGGLTSKGNWDVNANATNYEFFDEKPISYSSSTLTPSATGDGTFTSSNPTLVGYDLSNPTYDSKSFSHSSEDSTEAQGLEINNDGTKMYIFGRTGSAYQYSLSTAYDASTASYDNVSFDMSPYNNSAGRGLRFNNDGTKVYTCGNANDYVFQYSLSTAYDLSTASFTTEKYIGGQASTPQGVNFNNDGTRMYITNENGWIYQYPLSTPFLITSWGPSYDNTYTFNSSLTAKEMLFNDDGTKMYILHSGATAKIRTYSLSTAYDMSTASYDNIEADLGFAIADGSSFILNNNGSKIYVNDPAADTIKQYSVGTEFAFNAADVGKKVVGNSGSAIITATSGTYQSVTAFADTSAISSWQLFGAQGKSDGSGIQLSGFQNGYDIANASYDNVSFSLQAQDSASAPQNTFTGPKSLRFNNDGTKMYFVAGNSLDHIFEYDLSTAWDLSSASYNNSNLVVTSQTTSPNGIEFSSDGTKLFLIDEDQDKIWKYNLSTAWDLSSASYSNNQTPGDILRNLDAKPGGLVINSDGTKILWLGSSNERVYQMTLSTAYDLSTASMDTKLNGTTAYVDVSALGSSVTDINISSDGKKLFLVNGYGTTGIYQYDLANPYEINDGSTNSNQGTASYNNIYFSFPQDGRPSSVAFDNLGTKMYAVGMDNDTVYQYSTGEAATPYSQYFPALTTTGGQINSSSWVDIDSMVADETKNDGDVFYAVSTDDRTSWGVIKNGDGVRKIARNNSGTWQYNNNAGTSVTVSTGFDLTNVTYDNKSFSFTLINGMGGIEFKPDGTKVYVSDPSNLNIRQYNLSTAWDISTAVHYGTGNTQSTPNHIRISDDGTQVYYLSQSNDYLYSDILTTPWDITTISYNAGTSKAKLLSISISGLTENSPQGFDFADNGSKLYMVGQSNQYIYEWSLSTPWDISTASIGASDWHNISSQEQFPEDLVVSADGTKILVVGNGNDKVFEYVMSTAFDITTATYTNRSMDIINSGAVNKNPTGLALSADGMKLYYPTAHEYIWQYSISGTANAIGYGTSETWVNGTNNNEHATLQEALGAQSINRMDKAQLQAVTDPNHYVLGDTLDLMIAPYAASGTSPLSDGVTIGYQADALIKQAINGTDYEAEFPATNKVKIKSLAAQNLKIRII